MVAGNDSTMRAMLTGGSTLVTLVCLFIITKLVRRYRQRAREARLRLDGEEVSQVVNNYGSISRPQGQYVIGDARSVDGVVIPMPGRHPDPPRWVI